MDGHPALIKSVSQAFAASHENRKSLQGREKKHIGPTERSELTLADSFGRVKGIDLSVAIRQISELSIWRGKNASPGRGLPF